MYENGYQTPVEGESQVMDFPRYSGKADSVADYVQVLLKHENMYYPSCNDYLSILSSFPLAEADPVSESWRRKLCEWCYEVVDHFSFDREVVAIALNYLDRVVSEWSLRPDSPVRKRQYQLYAVTSLYMAIKLHGEVDTNEGPRRKLKIDAFYELSRKQFDVDVIEKTEREILSVLDWKVNPPTCLRFISTLLGLCPHLINPHDARHSSVLGSVFDVARYLAELSVCQSDFAFSFNNSCVAYAAILCAIEALNASIPLPQEARTALLRNIAEVTGYTPREPTVLRACHMLKQLCPSMFESGGVPPEFGLESLNCEEDDDEEMSHDGKSSPVCVVDTQDDSARRKRGRNDESWRSISAQINS